LSEIRDRVKDLRRVPASSLRRNPENWRTHPEAQSAGLSAMLERVGISGAVVARELPDGSLELIDGHLRAETLGDREIPVLVLDVDEAEARALLATYDPIGDMAGADSGRLAALVAAMGPTSAPLDAFLAAIIEDAAPPPAVEPPAEFPELDENLETNVSCPKCGFAWSAPK